MKLLIDECVGPTVSKWLQEKNFDAISIYDELQGIDDDSVLNKALSENRILITSDKDFGEMIFKNKRQHCGVILLRLSNEKPSNKTNVLEQILKNHSEELFGNFVVATETTLRVIKQSFS